MNQASGYVPGLSSEAVRSATGKEWAEWFRLLDEAGAADMGHKQIVAWLRDEAGLESGWWQQSVTVEYEKARGKRAPVGETADAGFQVGAQRTVAAPAERVWEWLATPPGRNIWLGEVDHLLFEKGRRYETATGARGEVRSVQPGKRLRLTWQPNGWRQPSTLQITLTASGDRCTIGFHHEKLPDLAARQALRERWLAVLDELEAALQ